MKTLPVYGLLFGLYFTFYTATAQVGRYEEPTDTMHIGGKAQKDQEIQFKGRDQLIQDLKHLEDSIGTRLKELDNPSEKISDADKKMREQSRTQLRGYGQQVNNMISQLQSDDWTPKMTQQFYQELKVVRKEFNRLRKD